MGMPIAPVFEDTLEFDPVTAVIKGRLPITRYLADVQAIFADQNACQQMLAENPLLYSVTQIEDHDGAGQIHYGLGILMPGKVGREYFMTKGHLHAWRPAAEVYIGVRGRGMMLLEDEHTGACRAAPLEANRIVYVPGRTAHRTINVGDEPLVYWGILSSEAGHDYGTVAERNFRLVVVAKAGKPMVMERSDYLQELKHEMER
ncbi:MAG: glucose-6-phosphate isomerase [Caldilineaceae bacterium]|jgi:glucose-6-phosphate isomerase|nr:glucose-6-phosphate isomerase [Caldilineaceae bacterium]